MIERQLTDVERDLRNGVNGFQKMIHDYAKSKGFWDFKADFVGADGAMVISKNLPIDNLTVKNTKLLLIVSEITECMEGLRKGEGIANEAEELADAIIRILDYAQAYELPLAQAIIEKHQVNLNRPYKHGGKKF